MSNQTNESSLFMIEIAPLQPEHLPTVAVIHSAAFPDRALTSLGFESVERYYQWLLSDHHPDAERFRAFLDDELVGFCFCGKFNGAMSGFLRENKWFLFFQDHHTSAAVGQ